MTRERVASELPSQSQIIKLLEFIDADKITYDEMQDFLRSIVEKDEKRPESTRTMIMATEMADIRIRLLRQVHDKKQSERNQRLDKKLDFSAEATALRKTVWREGGPMDSLLQAMIRYAKTRP